MRLISFICGCIAPFLPALAAAQATGPERLVFIGADPAEGRPGAIGPDLSVLSLPGLPAADAAGIEVLAALLRANPVSTFVATPESAGIVSGDLSLVADIALGEGAGGLTVEVGEDSMGLEEFGSRLSALVGAFNPARRQIAFVRVADPGDRFPAALGQLQGAMNGAGLAMSVVMVSDAACEGPRPGLHYGVIAGLPDRAPFGDAGGTVTAAEAKDWIAEALARDVARGAPCAARYSLILQGDDDPARVLVDVPAVPLMPEMESAVYMEAFEALFLLGSDDAGAIQTFLASCAYCPNEAELSARLADIGERQMALRLETGVWESIREDGTPARLKVYLENCQLCAFRGEAEDRIEWLEAAAEARAEENAAYQSFAAASDLPGLRQWVESCVACDFRDEASDLIAELEADTAFQEEQAQLTLAMERRNASMIEDWLAGCEICGAKNEAEEALAALEVEAAAAAPCVAAAGLPQQGGPRLLSEIDENTARQACGAALAAYPGNPLAVTALGRVEQAAGDLSAARAAYQAGIEAGLPAAYGLAAHAAYAPGDNATADYEEAETLALTGYALGDWLSGEVLTVLYSRGLIEGKGPEEAYAIALEQADAGNPVAQFFAGYFHRIGAGTTADDAAAVAWFEKAVAQGYLHANSFLAEIYEQGGAGVEADPVRAAQLYWTALEGGDPTARDRLTDGIEARPNAVIAEIQTRLQEAGIFSGRIDGIGGRNTASSVERFVELQLVN
ncbi:peptidoglycan-binding domain-containing protein [Wenxinia marina]|uniref:Sel1 repeat protein n=1 Tax=Wenxinia marina DSM 24838 TaxID=1123501 RepID=A0A0D0Q344_9RHOB|nr:peptidoglycan-binding domain-containing protein [Wenxinia marina]KIQ68979.1 Sel1 repeat protein [Wenxinia marina DSM 24838]GGL63612.1 hypothetical protein GCM10011392_17930 [Wenxinia marina]